MTKRKYAKAVVRKGGTADRWLTRDCRWTAEWKRAARFATQDAAAEAAQRCHAGSNYGIFPTSPNPIPRRAGYRLPFWARPEVPQARERRVSRAASRWAEKWDLPQD